MYKIRPICSNTIVKVNPHEWIPASFEEFLKEREHIIQFCGGNPLFRGHADRRWLLDSTFVRTCKKLILNLESYIRPGKEIGESCEYHQALFSLLLLKYDLLVPPKIELINLEICGIDPLFEMMKEYQQFPDKDKSSLKGTFFIDWTKNKDVGLFFANFDSNEHCVENRQADGALYICDMAATGKTLQEVTVETIIERMRERNNNLDNTEGFGCPLLFHPRMQKHNLRANNQDALYWAQMDLRVDLENLWERQEVDSKKEEYIFMKLVLPYESKEDCAQYLMDQKITHGFLFPDSLDSE